MGKKQVSQMNIYDYLIGITIGSIAADISLDIEKDIVAGIASLIIFGLSGVLVTYLTLKRIKLRRLLIGVPTVLINDGKIIEKNLRKEGIDINDLQEEARQAGYFDLSKVNCAVLEISGKISFLAKADNEIITRKDMQIKAKDEGICANVIIDGNYIDASNNANFYRLIYVAGDLNNKLLGENVSIINNIIENSDSTYGIYVDRIRNIDIGNNKITANSGQLFRLRNVIDGQFNNNNCHLQNETAGSFFGQIDLAHRISVCNNTFTSWQPMTFTIYHATGDTGCSNVFFYNNQAKWTEAFLRNWTRYGLYSTYGQYFPDFAGDMLPKQRPLDLGTVARYGASGREITDVAFAGTAGSNILTTSTDILPYFTINQTVQLKGAGTDGANLECVITDYIDSSHIKISTPVITSVSGVLMFCPPTLAMEELRPTS